MTLSVLLFGISRDIVGGRSLELTLPENSTVANLLTTLGNEFPKFRELTSLMVAVDDEYADHDRVLTGSEEIALIPPVSGG